MGFRTKMNQTGRTFSPVTIVRPYGIEIATDGLWRLLTSKISANTLELL